MKILYNFDTQARELIHRKGVRTSWFVEFSRVYYIILEQEYNEVVFASKCLVAGELGSGADIASAQHCRTWAWAGRRRWLSFNLTFRCHLMKLVCL